MQQMLREISVCHSILNLFIDIVSVMCPLFVLVYEPPLKLFCSFVLLRFTLFPLAGIILKMARLTKAGSSRGQKNISDSVSKPPSRTLIVPARELVQITAKVRFFFLNLFLIILIGKSLWVKL